MSRIRLLVVISLSLVLCVSAQETLPSQFANIKTVDYCILRKNPEDYNGKSIRLRGIYSRGFEVSAFYDKACLDDSYFAHHETWIDNFFRAEACADKETPEIMKTFLSGKAGSELEVTLIGTFRGSNAGGGFGHLNGYKFQITVSCVEAAKLLPNELYGCQRIDRTKPFHYLSYERMEFGIPPRFEKFKKPKKEKLIYLRLVNNSNCSIRIPTIEGLDSLELKDQSKIPVVFTLSSPCRAVAERFVTDHRKAMAVLSPGNSIYFVVPLRFLTTEPFEIRIPFDGQLQRVDPYYQPFYFSRYELPENLRKDLDCTKF